MAGKWEKIGAVCEKLYLENDLTLDDIFALLNGQVSRKTLGEWCTTQHWVSRKKGRQTSATRITEKIDNSIAGILDENDRLSPSDADAVTKLSKTKHQYMKQTGAQKAEMVIEVISWLFPFLSRRYPEQRDLIRQALDDFLTELTGEETT